MTAPVIRDTRQQLPAEATQMYGVDNPGEFVVGNRRARDQIEPPVSLARSVDPIRARVREVFARSVLRSGSAPWAARLRALFDDALDEGEAPVSNGALVYAAEAMRQIHERSPEAARRVAIFTSYDGGLRLRIRSGAQRFSLEISPDGLQGLATEINMQTERVDERVVSNPRAAAAILRSWAAR